MELVGYCQSFINANYVTSFQNLQCLVIKSTQPSPQVFMNKPSL